MKTRNIIVLTFIIVAIIQIAVPAKMIYKYDYILSKGKPYKFQIAPIDPSDPFRGNYISIRMREGGFKNDTTKNWEFHEEVYVLLDFDKSTGFARIKNITREKPQVDVDFVKAKISYFNKETVFVDYPFEQYYLEESLAPKAENMYSEALRDTNKISCLIVNTIAGDAVIKDLIINGQSIKEIK
jgi:uncharacterized membrane-anchored protein